MNYSDSGTRHEISALSTGSRVPESEDLGRRLRSSPMCGGAEHAKSLRVSGKMWETMSRPNQAQEPLEQAEDSSLQDQIFAVMTCLPATCTYNVGRTFNHACDDP